MNTIPALDDKTVQVHQWAVELLKLVNVYASNQNVNIVAVALRRKLAEVSELPEATLKAQAATASQTLDVYQATYPYVTTVNEKRWWIAYDLLRAQEWLAKVRWQAKRKGW